jgi:hypothetical protein
MRRFAPIVVLAVSCGPLAPVAARADEPPSETVAAPPPSAPPEESAPVVPAAPPSPAVSAVSPPIAATAPPAVLRPPGPEARFGNAGVTVVNGAIGGTIYHPDSPAGDGYAFTLAPAIDYFLAPNFSAGASLLLGYNHVEPSMVAIGNESWTYGVTAQLGFDVWLSERLSLWPRAFVSFEQERSTILVAPPPGLPASYGPSGSSTGTSVAGVGSSEVFNMVSTGASAPLLFHAAPHFFIGFGPTVTTERYNTIGIAGASNRTTRFGATTTIGGWL